MFQTGEKPSSSSSYQRKDLEFFKVFLPEFSSQEMVIPPAFIDILEKPLPKETSLIDEIGRLWCVETKLEDTDERVCVLFHNGWESFAKDQSLGFGDFLLFRYDGDSRFSVTVYANNGVKKDLTVDYDKTRVSVEKEPVDFVTKPECSGEGIRKRRWKSRRGYVAVDSDDEPENVPVRVIKPEYFESSQRVFNRSRDIDESSWWVPVKKHKGLEEWVPEKKHKGLEEPVLEPVYKPKNPHFVRTITQSSIHRMDIPITLLKSNGIDLDGDVELCDENGKKWPLEIVNDHRGMLFSKLPWLSFCESHKLMNSNKCVFEFIVERNGRCNEIQVRIFRGRLDTISSRNGYQIVAM